MKQAVKNRADYKPLLWLPKNTSLEILIYDELTIVKSEILFNKNDHHNIKDFILDNVIELYGTNLVTSKFQLIIDEFDIENIQIETLTKTNDSILIPVPNNTTLVKIITEVKIFPKDNTSLEGLYESNNMLCTQCEPEGFRKITWFPDRPDCLSLFTVRIEAPDTFNTILSNGNLVDEGVVKNKIEKTERIFKVWHDPFPKPSYLFALVVGNLECTKTDFITSSNKKIEIKVFTEIGNSHLTNYAIESLKNAMRWDENKYALEYDLNCFMLVAVSHFNMGAMENKGLNIFNSKFVLADNKTATDRDLKNIESIVAHEYFHNWTGNRVTCRDWFQLTLKEGLTVFRDQEFSADMNHRGVKRIEDVSLLRALQFPEDAGSNSHPIRPDKYIEINNFYTPTVYEKGAEVIRMIFNYLGELKYKKGINVYFKKYDGKAVTCENFLQALTVGSKSDLEIFKKWYSKSGTPKLSIKRKTNKTGLIVYFSQTINNKESDLPIPIKISFLDKNGSSIKFRINNSELKYEHVYLLSKANDKANIIVKKTELVPSILKGFSAPVLLKSDLTINEYFHIFKFSDDAYNRWDAIQNLYLSCYTNDSNISFIAKSLKELLIEDNVNYSLMALFLELPSKNSYENLLKVVDPISVFNRRIEIMKAIAKKLQINFEAKAIRLFENQIEQNEKIGERALFEKLIKFLLLIDSEIGINLSKKVSKSENMTLSIAGLKSLCLNNNELALKYLNEFYLKWKNNDLVTDKWFEMMSTLNLTDKGLEFIKKLTKHEAFDYKNPNKIRSVLGTFQKENIILFHADDATGYEFISEQVSLVDEKNPQIAARLILPLTRFKNYKNDRKVKIKKILKNISRKNISNDLSEIIAKALN